MNARERREQNEREILEVFTKIPYLTAVQVAGLGIYSQGSETYVKSLLKRFHEAEWIAHQEGKNELYIYWLAEKGRDMMIRLGRDISHLPFPYEAEKFIRSLHYPHYKQVTDLYVSCYALGKTRPYEHLLHDFHLKRMMQSSPLIPDLLVKFYDGKAIWFEWDNGTEEPNQIEAKIKKLCLLMNQWDDWFDTPLENFTFAFLTPISVQRASMLLRTIQNELFHNAKKRYAEQFRFAYIPQVNVQTVFYNKVYSVPYSANSYVSLL